MPENGTSALVKKPGEVAVEQRTEIVGALQLLVRLLDVVLSWTPHLEVSPSTGVHNDLGLAAVVQVEPKSERHGPSNFGSVRQQRTGPVALVVHPGWWPQSKAGRLPCRSPSFDVSERPIEVEVAEIDATLHLVSMARTRWRVAFSWRAATAATPSW